MSKTASPPAHTSPPNPHHAPWNDYLIAIAAVALMFIARAMLTPVVHQHYPFATFYFAIVFISMRYGVKPALITFLISFPLSVSFFGGNRLIFPRSLDEGIGNLFVFLNSSIIILMARRARRVYAELVVKEEVTRRHAEALEKETQARRESEQEREQSLQQLEDANLRLRRAMQETHHRVKNNLQVVSALVEMQEDPDFPPAALSALNRIGQHIRTLAAVHDVLTLQAKSDTEVTGFPVQGIIPRLLSLMSSTLEGREICCELDDLSLPSQHAASLALLINELVNNAIKHGRGTIEVRLKCRDRQIHLEVSDDGPGFPLHFDPRLAAHTGMELIESMGRWDLRGTVTYGNKPQGGALVQVDFPLSTGGTGKLPPLA